MKKTFTLSAAALILVMTALSCAQLDVVAKDAKKSFGALLAKSTIGKNPAANRWELLGPGSEVFSLASDFSASEPDIVLTLPAAPFLSAGLDTAKLPALFQYNNASGILVLRFDLTSARITDTAAASFAGLFSEFVRVNRAAVGYHEALDHYGIDMGDGNMFEWAKDPVKNDKDLVFVLNPEPFIAAGLDTQKLTDWVYAEVPVKDEQGNSVNVFKLLKPYNLD